MLRFSILFFSLLLLNSTLLSGDEVDLTGCKITAFATRDSALYAIGEKITFQVSLKKGSLAQAIPGQKITYQIQGDGGLNEQGSVTSAEQPVEIHTSLTRPGFVLLTLSLVKDKQTIASALAGAGVEPEQIISGTEDPKDFDLFWSQQIAQMRSRQPKISEEELQDISTQGTAKIYNIRIEDGVVNATGVLAVPLTASPSGHPLYVTFNGASGIGARASTDMLFNVNAITFNMNIHDSKNQVSGHEEILAIRQRPTINNYQYNNADQRELYAPKTIFLRIVRVLDYLKTRKEWNQKDLVAAGPSFGGAQAVVAAALDPQVNLCLSGAPAMCDHLGERKQQNPGWPKLLSNSKLRSDPEIAAKAAANSAYFDIANFARRVRCETVFGVGFIDLACPPTSVYAAYNNLGTAKKRIINATRGGHGGSSKPGELGAFEVSRTPPLANLLKVPLLKNGDFEFIAEPPPPPADKKRVWQFNSETVPWAWYFNPNNPGIAKLCQNEQAANGNNFLQVAGKNAFVGQSLNYIPEQETAKIAMKVRGKGDLCLRLSGKTQSERILKLDHPEEWREVQEVLQIPESVNFFWLKISGSFDLDQLQITPITPVLSQ